MIAVREKGERRIRFEFDSQRGVIRHRDRYAGVKEYQIELVEADGVRTFSLRLIEEGYGSALGREG